MEAWRTMHELWLQIPFGHPTDLWALKKDFCFLEKHGAGGILETNQSGEKPQISTKEGARWIES